MTIPGSANPLLLGADAGAAGYQISRSLRFNSADSAFLSRTPASAGNRKTWTWSGWVKRAAGFTPFYGHIALFSGGTVTGRLAITLFNDTLAVDNSGVGSRATTAVFRDYSAWYHIVVAFDTTNATASDRIKFYINGVQQVVGTTTFTPALNTDYAIGLTEAHNIGRFSSEQDGYFSGYLADIHFIDGQALTPASFAETNATTGQWVPKAYSGSYGTNGFRLDCSDNSAATAAALGKDTSGNGNNFTPNNLSVINNTQRWSRYFSVVGSGSSNVNGTELQAFDSSESTFNGYSGALLPSNYLLWSSPVTFTNAAVRVRVNQGDLGTGTLEVNGASRTITNAQGVHWEDFGTLSTFNFVKLGLNSASSNGTYIYAVEVNGSILVDSVFNYGNDSLVDTPTSYGTDTGAGGEVRGNYATLNPLDNGGGLTLSNGNLEAENTAASSKGARCTIKIPSTGKWYFEGTIQTLGGSCALGVATSASANPSLSATGTWHILNYAGSGIQSYPGGRGYTFTTAQVGNVLQVAYDADSGKLWFGVNNTWCDGSSGSTGNPGAGTNPTYTSVSDVFPAVEQYTSKIAINFGQRPFAYTAPSGFKALCDTNLPAPVVAKPNTVMDVVLWSGDGTSNRSITLPGGFSPDFVWTKMRNAANQHLLYDAVRGATLALATDNTNAETTRSTTITSFDSSGFTTGSSADTNGSGNTYVAWTWDAGTSTVTNTQGSITSQVRANASAGFSIVAWTPQSGSGTVGHGLNVAPEFIITKDRDAAREWFTYHKSLGAQNYLVLNLTNGITSNSTVFSTIPTSTVFDQGTGFTSGNGYGRQICYCFAPVAGYSSFGSYTGNGSTDGPFVYLGFRPRWILFKNSSVGVENWWLHDTARNTYNVMTSLLLPDSAGAEATNTAHSVDALSNGFKIRTNAQGVNGVHTIVYAAFAENPFQYARAR